MPSKLSATQPDDDARPDGAISSKNNPRRNFVQVSWKVTRHPGIADGAKVLYANLVSHDWGDNPCFPGMDKLAAYQGITRQQASRYLRDLKGMGLVTVKRRYGQASLYDLEFDESKWNLDACENKPCRIVNPSLRSSETTVYEHGKPEITSMVNPSLRYVDTVSNTQLSNTQKRNTGGASAPTPPSLTIVDDPFAGINDLPEWDAAGEPLTTAHNDKPDPVQEQAIAEPSSPPVEAPTPKTRKRALRYAEPDVYAAAQAIKAAYIALTDLVPNTYADSDCEKLARACTSVDEAIAVMHATYNETWRDGTQPNRKFLKLSKVLNMVPAYRRGDLAPAKTAPAAATGRKPAYQGLGGGGDGRRAWKPCCPLCGAEVGTPHNIKDPLKIGVRCEARVVTDADLKRAGEVAS